MPRRKDWTKEFVEMAGRDESPEVKTGQILDLIAERDELLKALKACHFELLTMIPRVTPQYRTSLQQTADFAKRVIGEN